MLNREWGEGECHLIFHRRRNTDGDDGDNNFYVVEGAHHTQVILDRSTAPHDDVTFN